MQSDSEDSASIGLALGLNVEAATVTTAAAPSERRPRTPGSRVELVEPASGWRDRLYVDGRTQGVALGWSDEGLVHAEALRPVLVFGPQRSRKTTGFAIPTLLEWEGPAIVTSIRSDIFLDSYALRSSKGTAQVYEPMGQLIRHGSVVGWNPLEDCHTWDGAVRASRAFTEAGALELREGAFWYGLAGTALAPYLFAAGANGYSMSDVARWIRTQEEFEVRALLQATGEASAIESADAFWSMEARLQSSVYGTLLTVLRVFEYSAVCESAKGGFNVDQFFNGEPNTLYLCAPADHQADLAPLFVALLRRILREAYDRDATGCVGPPLLVLLDEAANIAPLAGLDTLASTAAGCGIQLVTIFQDASQVVSLYGESKAMTITNNHSALLVLPGNRDPRLTELVQSLVGDEPIYGVDSPRLGSAVLRRLPQGSALCIYENLSPLVLTMRSSSHDQELQDLARSGGTPPGLAELPGGKQGKVGKPQGGDQQVSHKRPRGSQLRALTS